MHAFVTYTHTHTTRLIPSKNAILVVLIREQVSSSSFVSFPSLGVHIIFGKYTRYTNLYSYIVFGAAFVFEMLPEHTLYLYLYELNIYRRAKRVTFIKNLDRRLPSSSTCFTFKNKPYHTTHTRSLHFIHCIMHYVVTCNKKRCA